MQDTSQKFFLWGVFFIIGITVLMWLLQRRCKYCQDECWKCDELEGYSPYRHTGGCPPRTGYNYLDVYEQEQYYRKYPYIYPTPQSYVTAWYAGRRQEYDFLDALKKMQESKDMYHRE